jgi:hypothetical protein
MTSTDQVAPAATSTAAYLAEYEFIREGMRQDQRERHGFLGFALAASGLILGLIMRSEPQRTASQVCFLVCLAAIVILVAERLTIRASQGVASGGAYMRLAIEPNVPGLEFQARNREFIAKVGGVVSASQGFALAYLTLTAAFVAAWVVAPVTGDRTFWHSAVIGVLALVSAKQSLRLLRSSSIEWSNVNEAWEAVLKPKPAGEDADPIAVGGR